MRKISMIPILATVLLLAACGDDTREAGGVTRGEADALDDAAEMVEQQRLPADAVAVPPAATDAGEAARPAGASTEKGAGKPGG
ncbi:MAG: hypothetical protein J0M19_10425 [Sphingomonadales bacterium]|nr:hypothetical protein [Sphingomonadales bacterium]